MSLLSLESFRSEKLLSSTCGLVAQRPVPPVVLNGQTGKNLQRAIRGRGIGIAKNGGVHLHIAQKRPSTASRA